MHPRVQITQTKRTRPVRGFLSRFVRDEDGNLIVFGVFVFLVILMVGGIGVDLMHFERERAKLQNTLDRAVLAAADLDQSLSSAEVVADYFAKAGLTEYLSSVTVDQGIGYSTVSAHAQLEMATQFMHMTGVDTLSTSASADDGDASIASTAEERIDGVEISLVLDISNSMNSNSKIGNLKAAARDFIDTMIDNTEDGKLSISIVPYATQAAMPASFIDEFNYSRVHNYSSCANFQGDDFESTSMSLVEPLEQTMHFDPWFNADGRNKTPMELVTLSVCFKDANRQAILFQNDPDVLKTYISNMSAHGNTSIDVGMKWGTALLDPSLQPVVDHMIADGTVDPIFSDLPHNYDNSASLKVIVVMTDGQNTSQFYVADEFREGASDIWWNADEGNYSVYDPATDRYYWPHDDSWNDHRYGDEEDGDAVNVSYPDLWARTTLQWNLFKHYRTWMPASTANDKWYYDVRKYVNAGTKNARTKSICDAAKDEEIIIFSIGFEASATGESVLLDCASSPSHFHAVTGEDGISDAFASIASSIRKLRLTQ